MEIDENYAHFDRFDHNRRAKDMDLKKAALLNSVDRSLLVERRDGAAHHDERHVAPPPTFLSLPSSDDLRQLGIADVDAQDAHSPTHVSDFVNDIYRYLRFMEVRFALPCEYLASKKVTPRNRQTLLDWLVTVHKSFALLPETLHLTVRLLDSYLHRANIQNRILQLVGVTCLWIASKFEEIYAPNVDDLLYVTENAFTLDELCACERTIVAAMHFQLNCPTSLAFLKRAAKVARVHARPYNVAKFALECAFLDYASCHFVPSHQAASALYLAQVLCVSSERAENGEADVSAETMADVWSRETHFYTGYRAPELTALARHLAQLVQTQATAPSAKKSEVFKKYRSASLGGVAALPMCQFAIEIFDRFVAKSTSKSAPLKDVAHNCSEIANKFDGLNVQ